MHMPTVIDAARSIRSGRLTSEALTRACIDAIERHNPALNAFVHVDFDAALAAAREVDRCVRSGAAARLGPLAGIPFGVKDLEHCAGMPTTKRFALVRRRSAGDGRRHSRRAACAPPARFRSARPRRRSSARGRTPRARRSALPATRGIRSARRVARAAGRARPWRRASCRSAPRATAVARSARRPASPGWSGSRPTYGRIPTFGVTHLAQNAVVGSLATTVADMHCCSTSWRDPIAETAPACRRRPGDTWPRSMQLDVEGRACGLVGSISGFAIVEAEVASAV